MPMPPVRPSAWLILIGAALVGQAAAQKVVTPDALRWEPGAGGITRAGLFGDSTKPGPFTSRTRAPDGYQMPPHFHGTDEYITVLQGALLLGIGDAPQPQKLGPGSFVFIPAGTHHFFRAQGETIYQIHGVGPRGTTYVNPADDPQNKAKKK
jgi:mannose-6-phosphate isomerase-like protein (cupin superfamily)